MRMMMRSWNCVKNRRQQLLLQRMPMILAFTTRSVAEICCEFLHLRSCICWGTPKNMDTAEWNSNMHRILSRLSPLSRRVRTNSATETDSFSFALKTSRCFLSSGAVFPRTAPRSRYGSMMLKGVAPVIGNWFIFSIISVSSSALPSTLTAFATVS